METPPHRYCDVDDTASLSAVTTLDSSPATFPGPSTPSPRDTASLDDHKETNITPPTRPKSTPFPQLDAQENCSHSIYSTKVRSSYHEPTHQAEQTPASKVTFANLPIEIHEAILDHLFGVRAATTQKATGGNTSALRSWGTALRHSRRKQLSELALINSTYCGLVQSRIFRHIKLKATVKSMQDALDFFTVNDHLQEYVKHGEFWFPRWELRQPLVATQRPILSDTPVLVRSGLELSGPVSSVYQQPIGTVTVSDILTFVQRMSHMVVVTLEGGNCKKSTMVKHFTSFEGRSTLKKVHSVQTLVCKGSWNLMRSPEDLLRILQAFPNLVELHTSYNKCKGGAYLTIARSIPQFPSTIRHINISFESEYSREAMSPKSWKKAHAQCHTCIELARLCPQLESFVYCGRLCYQFFRTAMAFTDHHHGNTRLKLVDITVKNCCRHVPTLVDGTGSTNIAFIRAFEALVVQGIVSLKRFHALKSLRVRFVDLQSTTPFAEPFFQLKGNHCTGLWSESTLAALAAARPQAGYLQLLDGFGGIEYDKEGKPLPGPSMPKSRIHSMKVSSYEAISNEILIN